MLSLRVPVLGLFLFALLAGLARADIVACGPAVPPGVICLTGNVSDTAGGGPLVAGKIYHLSGTVTIPSGQSLTVEGGAILKFHPNAELEARGTLACGAAILTSIADDTAGGDTNGDGPSVGMPGDWIGVFFFGAASAASGVDGAQVRFATTGLATFGTPSDSADATFQQVVVSSCSNVAFSTGSFSRPIVTGCAFEDSRFAVEANIEALPGFIGNGASGNTFGDCIEIIFGSVKGNVAIGPQNSLDSRPFAVCSSITVEPGATLNLLSGTILKFGDLQGIGCSFGVIAVQGILLTDGVVLTSLEDDSIGGDLDKSGFSIGTPGDWGTLMFFPDSDASLLKDTLVRFGGFTSGVPFTAPAIDLMFADVTLDNVDVVECSGDAMRLNDNSFPTVTGCSFSDNLGSSVVRVLASAVGGFSNNAATNNALDAIEVSGGNLAGFAGVDAANSLNDDGAFIMRGPLTVQATGELVLGPGVALKWSANNLGLDVLGTLTAIGTAADPVVLTTLRDDSVVGDTNKDGGATQAVPGDWVGVELGVGAGTSVLDGVVIRYAGSSSLTQAALEVLGDPTIANTVVELSETAGMDLKSLGQPTVTGSTFQDNGEVAVVNAIIRALSGFSGCTATGNLLGDYIRISNGNVSFGSGAGDGGCTLELGPDNALAPGLTFVSPVDVDVPVGCQLSLLGGTIFKFEGNPELDVDGTLQVGSVGGGTTVLTSIEDDSVAGDTAKDGFTEGTPGDWQGVSISAPGTSIEDALIRFAGSGGQGLNLVNADAQLKGVRVEDCLGAGMDLNSSSLPLVDGSSFDRNDLAVDGVPLRALPGFSNSTAEDNKAGDYQRITDGTVAADLLVRASQSLIGGVFVLADSVDVLTGATLTLDPSTTFKAEGSRLVDVDGTLVVNGPVVFTTLPDDINGDTNKDMDTTAPVPGSWQGFFFGGGSDASVVTGLRTRYAGASGFASIRIDAADVKLLDSTVELGAAQGLRLSNDARPEVRRTAFEDNQGIAVDGVSVGAIAGFTDDTASGNAGDYMRVTDGGIAGQATIARWNALNGNGVFVVDATITVDLADALALLQGVILKFQGVNRNVLVNGVVSVEGTGLEPVVLTSVNDDSAGGDTRKDGAATAPAPGDWGRFEVGSTAGASSVEHLHARYGGAFAFAAIELESDLGSARSIRADFSSTDGIRGHRHLGDAANWVAFGNLGDGIDLAGGAYDLVHATAADNGAVGIRKNGAHMGTLWSAISFANGGAPVSGFLPGEVFSSNAGPDFAGFDGNVDVDPQFVDLPAGDLSLAAGSPVVDAADFNVALGVVKDHREASRILDDDLDGTALPDMGAFERAAYELTFGGEPKLGTTMSFTVLGPPGTAFYALGFLGGETFLNPFGFTLFGPLGSQIVLGVKPVGQPVFVPIPASATFAGTEFGVQGLGLVGGLTAPGNAANLYRGTVFGAPAP